MRNAFVRKMRICGYQLQKFQREENVWIVYVNFSYDVSNVRSLAKGVRLPDKLP